METKHTKGIWRTSNDYNSVTVSPKGILEGAKSICTVSDFGKTEIEQKANAKLIAAAPELLEALREIIAISDRNHTAWDKAKEAIKKATE